jgi:holo-[acyl-carrier protein] synthase
MIIGIGIDIIEVQRVADKIMHKPGFKELVFSEHEINYCEKNAKKFEHYAARFAAKEAFLKAIGTGWTSKIALNEIQISNDEHGKPELSLTVNTGIQFNKIFVSLSHLTSMATAIVIIEN